MTSKIKETLQAWDHLPDFEELVTVVDELFSVMLDGKQIDREQAIAIISALGSGVEIDPMTLKDIYNFGIILSQYDEINDNTIKQSYSQLKSKP